MVRDKTLSKTYKSGYWIEDKLTGAATEQKVRILKIRAKAAAAAAEAIARLAGLPGLPGPRAYVVLVGDSG